MKLDVAPVHFVIKIAYPTGAWYVTAKDFVPKTVQSALSGGHAATVQHPMLAFAQKFEDHEIAEDLAASLALSNPSEYVGLVSVVPVHRAFGSWTEVGAGRAKRTWVKR